MPNHAHLIVAPTGGDGLRATFAEAHRRYTGTINARFRWTGHLFQAGHRTPSPIAVTHCINCHRNS
jgi:hypothetical protein